MEKKERNNELIVSENFLNEAMNKCSKTLVGKIMKRFEILKDKEDIKASIKELVYESYRTFKEIIKSYSYGVRFISKKPEK